MRTNDYLTQIRADQPINKSVTIVDGTPVKQPASVITNGRARTVHVPDVDALSSLLKDVADDPCMVLAQGFFEGSEPSVGEVIGTPFNIASVSQIEQTTGQSYQGGWVEVDGQRTTARLKANMQPSSWLQIDRDYADGLPADLSGLSEAEYLKRIGLLIPDFEMAGMVRVASTSSRVLFNGQPLDASGCRYWFQIEDAGDLTFGHRLLLQAAINGLAFHKINKSGAKTLWTIFDPTVFSHERLVFDGQPTVYGEGLSLTPDADIKVQQGRRVDSGLVSDVSPQMERELKKSFGISVQRVNGIGRMEALADDQHLTLDTVVDTVEGQMSVRQFWESDHEHLRCQATFRDSSSWNGFLKRDPEGLPRLFDNGLRTWFELPEEVKREVRRDSIVRLIDSGDAEGLLADQSLKTLQAIRQHTPAEYQRLRLKLKRVQSLSIGGVEDVMKTFPIGQDDPTNMEIGLVTLRTIGSGNLIHQGGLFWFWDEDDAGVWKRVAKSNVTSLKKHIHKTLREYRGNDFRSHDVTDILELIRPETHRDSVQWNLPDGGINVLNGELIVTKDGIELISHRKAMMSTIRLPAEYRPEATCPQFDQFLIDILRDQPAVTPSGDLIPPDEAEMARIKPKIRLIQQMMGHTLIKHCGYEKMIFLTGPSGNGKSQLLTIISQLCGLDNICAVQPASYGNEFHRAHMEGKLANIVTETGQNDHMAEDAVKSMVSGEVVTVADKFADPREVIPFATLWHGTNNLPKVNDDSNALIKRTIILELKRDFRGEKSQVARLGEKIAKAELSGILNFALAGLVDLMQREGGNWVGIQSVTKAVTEWVRRDDTVYQFIGDECLFAAEKETSTNRLYQRYETWCMFHSTPPVPINAFGQRLGKMQGIHRCKINSTDGSQVRGWRGIDLVDQCRTAAQQAVDEHNEGRLEDSAGPFRAVL